MLSPGRYRHPRTPGTPGEADSLEHKMSTEFFQEVSNVQQATQLASTGRKRNKRDSDDREEEEDNRRKLGSTVEPELGKARVFG